MIKRASRKAKKERETHPIRGYLNDQDFKLFLKKAKEEKYNSQSAFVRDIVLSYLIGAPK